MLASRGLYFCSSAALCSFSAAFVKSLINGLHHRCGRRQFFGSGLLGRPCWRKLLGSRFCNLHAFCFSDTFVYSSFSLWLLGALLCRLFFCFGKSSLFRQGPHRLKQRSGLPLSFFHQFLSSKI